MAAGLLQGWSRGDVIALFSAVFGGVAMITGAMAVIPMTRDAARDAWRAVLGGTGVSHRRYANRFAKVHGSYLNPYLNREERLDLRSTYVPLSFRSADDAQLVESAAEVLADLRQRRTVIVGSPGSGKSTLLQAHGVGVLGRTGVTGGRFPAGRRLRIVPFLVKLRDLATFLDPDAARTPGGNAIVGYLISEVLLKEEFFKTEERAARFLKGAFTGGDALVMLDGLDEVSDDKLDAVAGAIDDLMNDGSEAHPTRRARILLTCRSQNFDVLRDGWIDSSFAPYKLCALAPFGDGDIMAYLNKFGHQQRFSAKKQPPLFTTEQGPRRFFDAIREDDKIDLLRVPLILAMAVSLYAEAPDLIPSTIDGLYKAMVREMLDRHSFRGIPDGTEPEPGHQSRRGARHSAQRRGAQSRYNLNQYDVPDKYSLLRQFALEAAKQARGFGDFTRESLEEFAVSRVDSLNMDGRPGDFVEEIIGHSGLLTSAGRDDLWHYAHRSIQEFLAAEELRLDGAAVFLLDRAGRLEWRQAIQFYVVGQDAQQIDGFLKALAARNPELAVRCLQACRPSVPAASEVFERLRPDTRDGVTALAAATRCPLTAVRALAVARLKEAILDPHGVFYDSRIEIEELLPLLDSMTRTKAADIATVIPKVISRLPDDPRLVGPLWRCLSADGMEAPQYATASADIVGRLLELVTSPAAFAELAAADPDRRPFLNDLRQRAYPFHRGRALPQEHNLVTLLAWAEYLKVLPGKLNLFFAAKAAGELARVEDARLRTVKFSLCWPARAVSGAMQLAALGFSVWVLVTAPGLLRHPFGWLSLLVVAGAGVAGSGSILLYLWLSDGLNLPGGWGSDSGDGNAFLQLMDYFDQNTDLPEWIWFSCLFGLVALSFAIAPVPLLLHSLTWYLVIAISAQTVSWATTLNFFNADVVYYLSRPSEFVNVYEDPKSQHWLGLSPAKPPAVPSLWESPTPTG